MIKSKIPTFKGLVTCPSCKKPRELETTDEELLKPGKAPKCFQCFMDNK